MLMSSRTRLMTIGLAFLFLSRMVFAQESSGLVGYWNFDTIIDDQVPDLSGNGNLGRNHGARQVKRGDGYALRFDGMNDYVDCGNGPSLNLKKAVSVSAWVFPEARPATEPAIVMKEDTEVYGLTMYKDGRCYWYVSGGGNNLKSGLSPGVWHYVVGAYDGKTMNLYMDGKSQASRKLSVPVKQGGNLLIGKRGKAPFFFKGMIDEVKIYNRALSADEVKAQYKVAAKGMLAERPVLKGGEMSSGKGFEFRVGNRGGMQVEVGKDVYFVESSFSYPGKQIGHNHLSEGESGSEPAWRPNVRRVSASVWTITASGKYYSVVRKIVVGHNRIRISDTLANKSSMDVGVLINHLVIADDEEPRAWLSGVPSAGSSAAENPTVLMAQKASQLGVVAEDSISRTQFDARAAMNQAGFGLRHFGMSPGRSVTLEWTLYPFEQSGDYWVFINRVREDWGVNFTMTGPGTMLSVTSPQYWPVFSDRKKCAAWLKRSNIKILSLAPWLDYDNLNHRTGNLTSRAEYKEIMQKVKAVVKSVDPSVKIIGDIEAPFVSLPRDVVMKIYNSLPANKRKGYHEFTKAQTEMLKSNPNAWAQWSDSAVINRKGYMQFESYKRGQWPMIALTVRPALYSDTQRQLTPKLGRSPGKGANGQHRYLMEQAKYVIEECGLDGFYVDSFTGSKHWHYGYGYDKWDGVTVDIDSITGRIVGKYTDLALAGTESRRAFMQYGLDKGGTVVTNGHPIARETQSMPVVRFNESEWVVDVYATPEGERPPIHGRLCKAHLASPVALGVRPHRYGEERGKNDYAKIVMLTAIHYLRHGVLYYHYGTYIPGSGPGGGEHGPINHMFPITPKRLGEGFIVGKERIVTCVSKTFEWSGKDRPKIRLFDIRGRTKDHDMKATQRDGKWLVDVRLADWQEIAVLE